MIGKDKQYFENQSEAYFFIFRNNLLAINIFRKYFSVHPKYLPRKKPLALPSGHIFRTKKYQNPKP